MINMNVTQGQSAISMQPSKGGAINFNDQTQMNVKMDFINLLGIDITQIFEQVSTRLKNEEEKAKFEEFKLEIQRSGDVDLKKIKQIIDWFKVNTLDIAQLLAQLVGIAIAKQLI